MSQNQKLASPSKPAVSIVLTGGGSGGHITPLLSLAHALKKNSPKTKINLIAWRGDKLDSLGDRLQIFDHIYYISAGKFRRYYGESFLRRLLDIKSLFLNSRDFFRVMRGASLAGRVLKKVKPDVVFLKGGFVSVPVAIAAKKRKIPIVTHDSDAIGGLANKIAGRWAVFHATGLPPEYYDYPEQTVRQVGIPVDERLKPVTREVEADYRRQLGIPRDSRVLLVGGAGLGARDINQKMLQIAPELFKRFENFYFIHITGAKHLREATGAYQNSLSDSQLANMTVMDFTPDFYKYAGAADLIISRAGATTIAELAIQKKALLLIPAPFLSGGHQLKNAEHLEKLKAVEVADNDIAPEDLLEMITQLMKDDKKRGELAQRLGQTASSDAAEKLAELLLQVARNTNEAK